MRPFALLAFAAVVTLIGADPARAEDEKDAAQALIASGDVGATISIQPATVVMGQKATLALTLRTTSYFAKGATLPEPEVAGAFLKRFSQMAINGNEREGGRSFTTQTWEWYLFAPRPGRYEVPALDVVLRPAGEDRKPLEVRLTTEPLTFEAVRPDAAGDASYVVAVPSLTLEETIDRSLEGLMVGDAVVRTVVVTMDDAPAMFLPPLAATEMGGVGVYTATPRVEDTFNRGDLEGRRSDRVTYVFEQAGHYVLPEVSVNWWNTKRAKLETAVIDAHEVTVAENPDLDPEQAATGGAPTTPDRPDASFLDRVAGALPWLAALLVAILLGRGALRRWLPALTQTIAVARETRRRSESAAFRRLEAVARANDPATTRSAFRAWLDRARGPDTTVEAFVESARDAELADAAADLGTRLYGGRGSPETAWSSTALLDALRRVREQSERARRPEHLDLRLNPPHPAGDNR